MTRESDDDKESELQHALGQVELLTSRAAHSGAPSSAAGFAAKYGPLIELCTKLIGRFPEEATLYYDRGQASCVFMMSATVWSVSRRGRVVTKRVPGERADLH